MFNPFRCITDSLSWNAACMERHEAAAEMHMDRIAMDEEHTEKYLIKHALKVAEMTQRRAVIHEIQGHEEEPAPKPRKRSSNGRNGRQAVVKPAEPAVATE